MTFMEGKTARTSRFWGAVVLLAAIVLIARQGPAIRIYNHTIDEPYHIVSAVAIYETGAHVMGVQHGPLPRIVAGIPLWFGGVRHPLPPGPWREIRKEQITGSAGADVLYDGPVPYWRVLELGRWAMLLVFPPLAIWYVFLLGKWLAGPRAGGLAAVFFSLDPTLLGHCFWICTDVAACAGLLFSLYHGLRWLARPTMRTAVIAGITMGLAISCKFSCVLLLPALGTLALLGVGRSLGNRDGVVTARRLPPVSQMAVMAVAAFLALWAAYLFAIGPMGNQDLFGPGDWSRVPPWISRLPVPMPSFWTGFLYLYGHDLIGHANYINGHLSEKSHWYYFPEAIALKEPVALLAGLVLAAGVLGIAVAKSRAGTARRGGFWRAVPALQGAAAVAIPGGIFLAVAMHGNINIGIRHILPVIPCLYLFVCVVMLGTSREEPGGTSRWRTAVVLSLIVVAVIETVPASPDYISYFNVIAGGSKGGDRYLIDSNLDWDQDVARLADYLHSPAAAGRTYTVRLFDLRAKDLAKEMRLRPGAPSDPPAGLFAISVNVRHGLLGYGVSRDGATTYRPPDYTWVTKYPHVARIGTSIDVYDLGEPATTGPTTAPLRSPNQDK